MTHLRVWMRKARPGTHIEVPFNERTNASVRSIVSQYQMVRGDRDVRAFCTRSSRRLKATVVYCDD